MSNRSSKIYSILIWSTLFLAIILLICITYYYEKRINPKLASPLSDRFISLLLFREYVDRPESLGARISTNLMWVISLFLSGAIIGKISSFFVLANLDRGAKMIPREKHYIICNYNLRTEGLIEEINIYQNYLSKAESIVIVNTEKNKEIDDLEKKYENVYFKQMDPTYRSSLEDINAGRAKCIILLLDYNVADADAKNVLIALAIRKLEKQKRGAPRIVAELQQRKRSANLEDAGVDEIISVVDLSVGLLAQSVINPQASEIYRRLLYFSRDTNELYYVKPSEYSPELHGQEFLEVSKYVTEKTQKSANPAILIGIKRGKDLFINPKKEKKIRLQTGDFLIVMCYDKPKIL